MFSKRGQVTLFVIIAVVVVIGILLYFYPLNLLSDDGGVNSEIRPIYDAVSDCIMESSDESFWVVGSSGGYYTSVPDKVDSLYVSYYFYDGENLMPSLDFIEGEMENYIADMAFFCAHKKMATMNDYDFYSGDVEVDVDVRSDDKVYFKVDYPFTVVKDNRSYYFDRPFLFSSDVRLYSMYEMISKMMEAQEKEPRAFCVNCAFELSADYGLYLDLWSTQPNDITFFVNDETSVIDDESYSFFFSVKYPEDNNYDPFEDM